MSSDFRKLIVWQKSMDLARAVYRYAEQLPKQEQFGLISQLQRCAVSIPSNIAEGSKRRTKNDFIQFLRIASGSAAELETQLILSADIYHIDAGYVLDSLKEVQCMLESLMRKL